ncbi:MAG: hypothetical protein IKB07_10095 [Lachnospiraceae bacterium]|nr:hypothetical protein [Lachnospiraceae bacterium]
MSIGSKIKALRGAKDLTEEERERIAEECRGYSEYILEHSMDDDARHVANDYLSRYYHRKGEEEKAWEYARKLSILCNSREFLITELTTGTERVWENQNLNNLLFHYFVIRMLANYELDFGKWLYTEEERMVLRDKKFALFSLLFEKGEDYGEYMDHLADSHEMQAREYAKRQNKEKCLYHQEQALASAVGFIEYMRSESYVHSSLLGRGYESYPQGTTLWDRENIAAQILSKTELPEYDSLRADAGFVELTQKLSEYAGENDY